MKTSYPTPTPHPPAKDINETSARLEGGRCGGLMVMALVSRSSGPEPKLRQGRAGFLLALLAVLPSSVFQMLTIVTILSF